MAYPKDPIQKEDYLKKVSGKNNHFYGKKHSPKTIELLKQANKKRGLTGCSLPQWWKDRISKGMMGHKSILKGENNPMWQGGTSFEPYALGWSKTFREQIRYRDKYTCQLCGVPEVECKQKLHVHHINYDKKSLDADNLIFLCRACHMKTNYYREYWITYFNNPRSREIGTLDNSNE